MKTKTKRRTRSRKIQLPRHRRDKTRVTIDFPKNEHRRLKALASLEGVTMQDFIRNHIKEKVYDSTIPESKFKELMEKILDENEDALRRLADQ